MISTRRVLSFALAMGALHLTSASAFAATTLVKVECNGSCSNVTLAQACGTTGLPTGLSCDSVANPGSGTRVSCGINGATCIVFGDFFTSDRISAYCNDTSGNDAVVTCQ
jgi:hypothetical protein